MSGMDHTLKQAEAEGISMKAPMLWQNAGICWFSVLEAQFKLNKISSQTAKFLHLTQALTAGIAQEVSDTLLAPVSKAPYNDLKKTILDWKTMFVKKIYKKIICQSPLEKFLTHSAARPRRQVRYGQP